MVAARDKMLNFDDARAQLSPERDHLRVLLEVTKVLVSNLDLPGLVAAVSSSLERAIPHEFAALALHEEGGDELVIQAAATKSTHGRRLVGRRIPVTDSAPGAAFTARRTVVFGEDDLTGRLADTAAPIREARIRSGCAVPLIIGDRALGTLTVGSLHPDAFTPESVALIEQVARQVAMAVANALAFREIAELRDKLAEERPYALAESERLQPRSVDDDGTSTLEGVERTHILRVLRETNWILGGPRGAAARLGKKRTTLQSMMRRLGITRPGAAQ